MPDGEYTLPYIDNDCTAQIHWKHAHATQEQHSAAWPLTCKYPNVPTLVKLLAVTPAASVPPVNEPAGDEFAVTALLTLKLLGL